MNAPVSELVELLSLERLEDNLFRGQSRDIGTRYVFGGQVLGPALSAAQATIDPATGARAAHSLHAYFLRAGDIEHPIVYDVDRTRDGGTFSVRRVTAIQHGKVIFFCAASFQVAEDGAEHQLTMPEVPKPEDIQPAPALAPDVLEALPTKVQRWLSRMGPFEFRHVYPRDELNPPKRPPYQQVWFRLSEHLAAEHIAGADVAALAAEQVVFQPLQREQFDQFGDGGGHRGIIGRGATDPRTCGSAPGRDYLSWQGASRPGPLPHRFALTTAATTTAAKVLQQAPRPTETAAPDRACGGLSRRGRRWT